MRSASRATSRITLPVSMSVAIDCHQAAASRAGNGAMNPTEAPPSTASARSAPRPSVRPATERRLGVRLRPHAKTHKVPEIARLQIAAGATGITVSKISEAEVFADAGIDDLFVAYQIVAPPQLERLVRLARSVRLRCAVDSREGAERLSRAATDAGIELGVMLEIDLGIGRTGVRAGVAAIELAQRISDLPSLELIGVYGFRGFRAYAEGTEARETWGRAEGAALVSAA